MLHKILLLLCLSGFLKIFSQTVEYGGKINTLGKEYLIILTNIQTPENSFSESTRGQNFIFKNIPLGSYKRCITASNFTKCDTILINKNLINDIIVLEGETQIKEVVISNKKPFIQSKGGVLEINVEGSPVLSNGTAFETLSKLPGVTYNYPNNSFNVKGKPGIQIQIDGQVLYMSNSEVINYLKSISSSDISDVEINSSPSAKYDASGNAGIINIKTKKTTREGYSLGASFNGTQGKYYKQNTGLRGQYNTKKSRYMLHYISSFNTDFEKASTYRDFLDTNTHQETYAKIKGSTSTLNAQYEHKYNKSNVLINSSLSFYNEQITQNTDLGFYNRNDVITSTLFSNQNSKNNLKTFDIGVNYNITNEKSKLTLKSNYIFYNIKNRSLLSTYQIPEINTYNDLQNQSPNRINIALSQIDYEIKLDSLSKFETGIKAIYQSIDSENNFFESLVFDPDKSDQYKYNEWIFGGYAQYNKNFNKTSFTFGSRLEYNPLKGIDLENNFILRRDPINLFPFFNFSYHPSKNNSFSLSYNKRINRPRFKNLMPFVYYVDQYTRLIGNPELKPSLSHQIELQYILKNKYIFSIAYFINKNQIYQTPIQDNGDKSTILMPTNINQSNSLSFNSNITLQPLKWWNLNVSGLVLYNRINDHVIHINSAIWSGQIAASHVFSLPKTLKLEFTTDYRTPFIQGPYKTQNLFTASIGVSQSFLDNKLKVSLVGNDLFRTYTIRNRSIIENQISNITQNFDTHWIRLGLVYKLAKGLKKDNSNPDKLAEELKSRTR
ncbi:outer membrane beta-barrel family protein [Chryseobacterium sp. MYb264]|uniref:outer membrane beta-barrel family protein n=1 Tax=Chryseobacterium sp. MYb264 TaxID=2745153 RepID=UPI002E0D3898|nr:outer membrane beta-barrel family protein [Chryseobacterium sp. MYb264]